MGSPVLVVGDSATAPVSGPQPAHGLLNRLARRHGALRRNRPSAEGPLSFLTRGCTLAVDLRGNRARLADSCAVVAIAKRATARKLRAIRVRDLPYSSRNLSTSSRSSAVAADTSPARCPIVPQAAPCRRPSSAGYGGCSSARQIRRGIAPSLCDVDQWSPAAQARHAGYLVQLSQVMCHQSARMCRSPG